MRGYHPEISEALKRPAEFSADSGRFSESGVLGLFCAVFVLDMKVYCQFVFVRLPRLKQAFSSLLRVPLRLPPCFSRIRPDVIALF